jgi:DNA-binding GntR family transcriptional regulator
MKKKPSAALDVPVPAAPLLNVTPVVAPVRAQVVAKLREAILSGYFAPGERLIETSLCEQMQVSRTSLREALRQLEAERLVTITPFRGPTVTEMTAEDAEQIYEIRALLEGHAAELFAARAKASDIAGMEAALARFEAAVTADDGAARIEHTDAFYEVLLQGCGNRIVVEVLEGLHARVNFLRYRSMSSPERANESLREMRDMLEAFKAKAPAEAAQAARNHVRRARDVALKVLSVG